MSDSTSIQRLEELEAGRILGDLSDDEFAELKSLSQDHDGILDGSLEWAAAQVEAGLAQQYSDPLPTELVTKVREGRTGFINEPQPVDQPEPTSLVTPPSHWWNSAPVAWAAAAVVTLLLVVNFAVRPGSGGGEQPVASLESRATDLVESAFDGLDGYESVSGKAVWSDALQEGYLELANVPVNDPTVKQYQLWIVDPERDEAPVDGGVFDIGSEGTVKVPIDAKLRVDQPQAFVITLEQPGGVVKSKQDVVVALAKAS